MNIDKFTNEDYMNACYGIAHVPEHCVRIIEIEPTPWEFFKWKILEPIKEVLYFCGFMFGISLMLFSYGTFLQIILK